MVRGIKKFRWNLTKNTRDKHTNRPGKCKVQSAPIVMWRTRRFISARTGFCSMKRLEVFPLDCILVHCRLPPSILSVSP